MVGAAHTRQHYDRAEDLAVQESDRRRRQTLPTARTAEARARVIARAELWRAAAACADSPHDRGAQGSGNSRRTARRRDTSRSISVRASNRKLNDHDRLERIVRPASCEESRNGENRRER
jgi:hypothetical protein